MGGKTDSTAPQIQTGIGADNRPRFRGAAAAAPLRKGPLARIRSRLFRRTAAERERELKLAHEVEALNEHAMVTLGDTESRITAVNEKFIAATGFRREVLIGQTANVLYATEDESLYHEIRAYMESGDPWTGETRIRCRDGKTLWTQTTVMPRVDENGVLLGTISIRTDITRIKAAAAEREIVASLHKLSDQVVIFCARSSKILYLNESAMRMFGWDRQTYPHMTVEDAEIEYNAVEVRTILRQLLRGESEHAIYDANFDGRPYQASVQLIRPEAAPPRFVAILRDMSERHQLDRAKDEFIATVSHELRSPLTSIKGAMGLILSGASGEISTKTRGLLEIAHRNADRLVMIVNDILDLEKIAAGRMPFRMEVGDLREVLHEAMAANQAYSDRFGVRIRLEGMARPARARFDADRIFQVLTNLLSNASKFSSRGGEIVAAIASDETGHIVSIRDNGVGIPKEALSTIFDRFQQADNSDRRTHGGTGLGLSIVKAIVETHGGTVDLDSTPGEGTTVSFRLAREEVADNPVQLHAASC